MLLEFIKAFSLIFIAELGDKSQILAMTFATKYPIKKVLGGIFIGAALNHALAVGLGSSLSGFINFNLMQIIAGVLFIGFGLWGLRCEDEEEECDGFCKYGAVLTVALAFFIGELGDKTQLAAITLGAESKDPLFIFFGTVLGMFSTSAIGIFIGGKLGKKLPERYIKIASSIVFIVFGIIKINGVIQGEKSFIIPFMILGIIILAGIVGKDLFKTIRR